MGSRDLGCLALALLTLVALGCGSPPPEPAVHFDLIEELALARQTGPAATEGGEAPRARADGETLLIPPGVRVNYSLELPVAARIVFEGVRPQGMKRGTLRVTVTPHDGETRPLARLPGERGRTEIEWQAEGPQVVRLTLRADNGKGGMAIRKPAIWVEPGTGPAEESAALGRRQIRRLRKIERPNIVLYLIDSLRADRLGCYGYDKPVSPAIDAFAESALVFHNATANSVKWTAPTLCST